jgi:hypothetical protein
MTIVSNIHRAISQVEIETWLRQFDPTDRWVPERLLKFFRYYDVTGVTQLLAALKEKIDAIFKTTSRQTIFVPCGEVASSASLVTYLYRQVNRFPGSAFAAIDVLSSLPLIETRVVILDDFAGSGHSAKRLWNDRIELLARDHANCEFLFACMVAHEEAVELLAKETGFLLAVADVIPSSEQPFSINSEIFLTADERKKARAVLEKYVSDIPAQGMLGYAETQSLIAFFFNTPDNTLPIFWAAGEKWQPLFRYGTDLATFETEVTTGRGSARSTPRGAPSAIAEFEALTAQEIDSEQAIAVLEEFPYKALRLLAPEIASLKIDSTSLRRIFSISNKLRYRVHEQHPVCTALFVVPDQLSEVVKSRCFASPNSVLSISDEAAVCELAELVDGIGGAVVISTTGAVLGCMPYTGDFRSDLVPTRLARAAGECRTLGALGFVFVGAGRVTILSKGGRLLTYRQATWYIPHPEILKAIDDLESACRMRRSVLQQAYRLAIEMSDAGDGAIMMIGDEGHVLALCDERPRKFTWNQIELKEANWAAVRPLAKQDGATIVTDRGYVTDGQRILRPPAEIRAVVPAGAGARHSSAAKMTTATSSVALVVSSDGAITLFRDGKVFLSDMT